MSQAMPEVDTSLTGKPTGMETGRVGIDSPIDTSSVFDTLQMPSATHAEFSAAFPSGTTNFSGQFGQATGDRASVIDYAKKFLGTPYDWGGTTPAGFDCSGFTQFVWKKFGVSLPRVSQNQANVGVHVDVSQLQPGDLVLFPDHTNNGMSGPGHVALWLGNGQIIEAPHTGANVRIRDLGKGERVFGVHLKYGGGK